MSDINGTPLLQALKAAKEVSQEAARFFLKPAPAVNGRLSVELEGIPVDDPRKVARVRGQWALVASRVNVELRALGPHGPEVLETIYKNNLL